jgi:S1-C subfamily serine protease
LNLNSAKEMSLGIPIDLFHGIKDSVFAFGQVAGRRPRPWIGIYTEPVDGGVAVIGLIPGGPASRAGIEVKDIILEIDSTEVAGRRELYAAMWKRQVGDELTLTIQRSDDVREVRVTSIDRADFYR